MSVQSDVVITSRIRLARNLKKYAFPNKMSQVAATQMIEEVKAAVLSASSTLAKNFEYYDLHELTLSDKMSLVEQHLISPQLVNKQMPCGVILYRELGLCILINEEDHIRIQCIKDGMALEEAYDLAGKIDDLLEEKLSYAYDEHYGYLTTCPTNAGTGMRASYMLHLPALEAYGQLSIILQAIGKFGLTVRGMYGEGTDTHGGLFQISNQITLGVSEQDIMNNLSNITKQIIDQERTVRRKQMEDNHLLFEDKIYRSYGCLRYAKLLSAKEAMALLSDVKLGKEMGLVSIENQVNIYDLMTHIQPANLQKQRGKELSKEEKDAYRASFIQSQLFDKEE